MNQKKKRKYAIAAWVCVLVAVTAAGVIWLPLGSANESANPACRKGVIANCDSVENEELSAHKVIDGDAGDRFFVVVW